MVVITGANGFIGSALVWELNEKGISDILCVDAVPLDERDQLLKKRRYTDFLQHTDIWDFLDSDGAKKIDWIIHMGANSSTTETNWEHLYENNTLYSVKLFEWCAEHGVPFIYASSAATYGAGELGYDDKTDSQKLKPLNLYGKSKVLFDRWVLEQEEVPPHWYGLKFFNVFGPNEYLKGSMASVAFKSFHEIKNKKEISLFKSHKTEFKDGEQMRDFVYVKEVTGWILELIEKRPKNDIYNMGFGKARTWNDMARAVFKSMEIPEKIKYIEMPENIRGQYQYFTEAKMDKWLAAGMSKPRWSLESSINDYVKNYLSHSDPYL